MLTWRQLAVSTWALFHLSGRIIFRRKPLFIMAGVLAYYGILYAFAVYRPGEGFGVDQALFVLVEIPGAILAIYLTMDLLAKERDHNTLETLFSTASSHYLIWAVRLVSVYVVLAVTLLIMSTVSYFLFAELPVLWGGLNAFLPAFLVANLTFFFSVYCRSANTAGMLGLGFLILVLLSADALRETSYFLFLKPFDLPVGIEDSLWAERVLINRLTVFGAGVLLIFLALRRMEKRERLLS
ncbi:MAG: hypothetical protein ACE5HV_02695 [Acidobacteriota bacterium]